MKKTKKENIRATSPEGSVIYIINTVFYINTVLTAKSVQKMTTFFKRLIDRMSKIVRFLHHVVFSRFFDGCGR